jgi:hypothetical protein
VFLAAALLAACAAAPQRPVPQDLLVVENGTGERIVLYADGEPIGWLSEGAAAGFRVGESCGPKTLLIAEGASRRWSVTVEGPVWRYRWRVGPRSGERASTRSAVGIGPAA